METYKNINIKKIQDTTLSFSHSSIKPMAFCNFAAQFGIYFEK